MSAELVWGEVGAEEGVVATPDGGPRVSQKGFGEKTASEETLAKVVGVHQGAGADRRVGSALARAQLVWAPGRS